MGVPLVASDVEPYSNTKGFIHLSNNDPKEFAETILKAKDIRFSKDSLIMENKNNYNLHDEADKLLTFLETLI
jgi:hypothetical protein